MLFRQLPYLSQHWLPYPQPGNETELNLTGVGQRGSEVCTVCGAQEGLMPLLEAIRSQDLPGLPLHLAPAPAHGAPATRTSLLPAALPTRQTHAHLRTFPLAVLLSLSVSLSRIHFIHSVVHNG